MVLISTNRLQKKFITRYHRRLEECPEILEELNRLVKPFILRRYKKNVIKELPDKIEKRLLVPLSDEQKVVYETYANYVKDYNITLSDTDDSLVTIMEALNEDKKSELYDIFDELPVSFNSRVLAYLK